MIQNLWRRLMENLTYKAKVGIVVSLFLIAFFIMFFAFLKEEVHLLKAIDIQIAGNQFERPLRELLEYLPQHDLVSKRLIQGDESGKGDFNNLQVKITEQFRRLMTLDAHFGHPIEAGLLGINGDDAELLSPATLSRDWDGLKRQVLDLTAAGSSSAHAELILNIKDLVAYIGDHSRLVLDGDVGDYYAMETTLNDLPEVQQLIFRIVALSDEAIRKGSLGQEDRGALIESLALLQSNLDSSRTRIGRVYKADLKRGLNQNLFRLFSAYIDATHKLIEYTKQDVLKGIAPKSTIGNFSAEVADARGASFLFWDQAIDNLDETLKEKKGEIWNRLILICALSFFCLLLGLFLAHLFVMYAGRDLSGLKDGITRFARGDLHARAPIYFKDENGKLSHAFNIMATHFEDVLGELNHLLEAIKKMAGGDFSVRLQVKNPKSDIGMVLVSFNQMVQTFSEIVGQLRELGINLTTSAKQITTASKEQEIVITEQEATTREISVTAHEISSTAKAFATTMNEVSHVAEETANLAQGGKESLTQMQTIMRHMVEASKNIASKLAILSEKAGNITSVITTITKVADQTNLLSLNASIEAEKAGEFGKSFAVIAREIRRLADLTAFATLDIEKMVGEIMSAVSTSVMGVDDFTQEIHHGVEEVGKVSEQLATIIEQVQVLNRRFEDVNQGMQSQAVGAEQIYGAIADLNQTARQTSSSLAGFRQTLQQLTLAASDLKNAVDFFCKSN